MVSQVFLLCANYNRIQMSIPDLIKNWKECSRPLYEAGEGYASRSLIVQLNLIDRSYRKAQLPNMHAF